MAIRNVEWTSYSALSCSSCNPSDVYLCVNPDKILPHDCAEGAEEATSPFIFHTIEATLIGFSKCKKLTGGAGYYTYLFSYDDAQLVADEVLESIDISGAFCKGCLTQWVLDVAGNDVTVSQDELGNYFLTNQHGCTYAMQVGETFDFSLAADSGPSQVINEGDTLSVLGGIAAETVASATDTVTVNVLISEDVTNALELDGNALYVPGLAGNVDVGSIIMTGRATAPAGWLLCDGSAVSRVTYANLFTAIGVAFGAGNGTTTFNIPNMQQKFPLGKAVSGTGSTLGGNGGQIDHTHTVPKHYHGMSDGADLAISASGSHLHTIDHDHPSGTTASNGDHSHFCAKDIVDSFNTALSAATTIAKSSVVFDPYVLHGSGAAANIALSSTNGAHTHTFDVAAYTGNSGSNTHTHLAGDFTGRIGLVDGGVDGDESMTSGDENPPFTVVNFIIKT